MTEEFEEKYKEVIDIINNTRTSLIVEDFVEDMYIKIKRQQKEIKELSDKLTEKICKGVEEEILEEYRQTIISKDKEIEELNAEILELTNQRTEGFWENDRLKKEIEELKNTKPKYIFTFKDLKEIDEFKKFYIHKDKIRKLKSKNIGQYINFYREIEKLLEE